MSELNSKVKVLCWELLATLYIGGGVNVARAPNTFRVHRCHLSSLTSALLSAIWLYYRYISPPRNDVFLLYCPLRPWKPAVEKPRWFFFFFLPWQSLFFKSSHFTIILRVWFMLMAYLWIKYNQRSKICVSDCTWTTCTKVALLHLRHNLDLVSRGLNLLYLSPNWQVCRFTKRYVTQTREARLALTRTIPLLRLQPEKNGCYFVSQFSYIFEPT